MRGRSASRRAVGVIARRNRAERPATIPSGIPTRRDSPTAASIRASVSMLSSHRPDSAKAANAESVIRAARRPPKRRTSATPAIVVPTHVSQISSRLNHCDEVVDPRAEALEDREDDRLVLLAPLGQEPGLEVVEVDGQRVPDEVVRPGVFEPPGPVGDVHQRHDSGDLDDPPSPPEPMDDDRRTGGRLGNRGHVSRLARRRSPGRRPRGRRCRRSFRSRRRRPASHSRRAPARPC